MLSLDRLLDAVLRSLCIVVCLRGSLLFVLGNTAELCSQRGGGPSGSVIVTPGPGPEECQHLRWATGGLRSSPVRTCWKALRAGLSRPSSLRYRWAVSVLSGRDPVAQDWVPFQVVPPGLVGKLCVPGSQDHLATLPLGGRCLDRSGFSGPGPGAFPGSPWRTCCESLASWALGNIEFTLSLGGRCAFRSDSLTQDIEIAHYGSLPAGASENREQSLGDCVGDR